MKHKLIYINPPDPPLPPGGVCRTPLNKIIPPKFSRLRRDFGVLWSVISSRSDFSRYMIVLPILWDFMDTQTSERAMGAAQRASCLRINRWAGTVAPSDNIFTALRNCYCVSSIQSIQFLFTITFWENIFLIVLCWDLTEIALFRTIWEFDWCFWFFELLAVQVSLSSFSRSFTVW